MSNWRRRAAMTAIRISASVMPANRKQWAVAMRTEMAAVENDSEALDFAIGCLWASAKERVIRIDFVARALNVGIPAGLFTLALFAAHLSGRHFGADPETATIFGILSAIFALAATMFLGKGAKALARLAGALILAYFIILALLYSNGSASTDVATLDLYRALAVEGVAIWSALFLSTVFLVHRNGIAAQADRRTRL